VILPENVIDFTKARFPGFPEAAPEVTPLDKGGSGRTYYRVRSGESSMIFVKYTGHREENLHFVDIAHFLARSGVQVPKVFFHDPAEGLIWLQDLGEEDLWSFRDADWTIRRSLYCSALRQVALIHTSATEALRSASLSLQVEFNENLYLWEQEYFFENCVKGIFGFDDVQTRRFARSPALRKMARELASLPRVLIHRDFQSQNIMIHEASAWLIDFQGMRPGLPHYDVASLLYDPYVRLSEIERTELSDFYQNAILANGGTLHGEFSTLLLQCAAQRLMQALGAYGFLGLKSGFPAFLRHVPAARASLREVLARLEGCDDVVALLDSAREPET
jgi:aminoglycoside/choline kinase family phosphotransferase